MGCVGISHDCVSGNFFPIQMGGFRIGKDNDGNSVRNSDGTGNQFWNRVPRFHIGCTGDGHWGMAATIKTPGGDGGRDYSMGIRHQSRGRHLLHMP